MREIKASGFEIARTSRHFWTTTQARNFYSEHEGRFYYPRLIAGMTSGPFMAMALAAPDAIVKWRAMLGPTKVYRGKWEQSQPVGLRARYGIGDTRNGLHGSDSPTSAQRELDIIFPGWDTQWWLERANAGSGGVGS